MITKRRPYSEHTAHLSAGSTRTQDASRVKCKTTARTQVCNLRNKTTEGETLTYMESVADEYQSDPKNETSALYTTWRMSNQTAINSLNFCTECFQNDINIHALNIFKTPLLISYLISKTLDNLMIGINSESVNPNTTLSLNPLF